MCRVVNIQPPATLKPLQRLAWQLGRDAGFKREPFRRYLRTLNTYAQSPFMDGYRAALMIN